MTVRTCQWCGNPLDFLTFRGRPRLFCGPKCRDVARDRQRFLPMGTRSTADPNYSNVTLSPPITIVVS